MNKKEADLFAKSLKEYFAENLPQKRKPSSRSGYKEEQSQIHAEVRSAGPSLPRPDYTKRAVPGAWPKGRSYYTSAVFDKEQYLEIKRFAYEEGLPSMKEAMRILMQRALDEYWADPVTFHEMIEKQYSTINTENA